MVIIKSSLGQCLLSMHSLTYQMIYSRFDPFLLFVLSTTNKIKINDGEPKGNGSLLLAISGTWLNSLARSITRGITKRFLLKKCCRCRLKSIEAGMRERSHIWPFVNFKLITVDWVKKEPPHCLFLRRFFFNCYKRF